MGGAGPEADIDGLLETSKWTATRAAGTGPRSRSWRCDRPGEPSSWSAAGAGGTPRAACNSPQATDQAAKAPTAPLTHPLARPNEPSSRRPSRAVAAGPQATRKDTSDDGSRPNQGAVKRRRRDRSLACLVPPDFADELGRPSYRDARLRASSRAAAHPDQNARRNSRSGRHSGRRRAPRSPATSPGLLITIRSTPGNTDP